MGGVAGSCPGSFSLPAAPYTHISPSNSKGAHAARDRIGPGLFTMDPDPAEKKFFENVFRVRDFSDVTLASEGETKNRAH